MDGVWLCCGVRSGAVKHGCGNGAVKAAVRWSTCKLPMALHNRPYALASTAPLVRTYVRFPRLPLPFFSALFSSFIFFFSWLQRLLHRSYIHRTSSPTRLLLRLLCNRSLMHLLGWVSFLIFSCIKSPLDAIVLFIIYLGLRI